VISSSSIKPEDGYDLRFLSPQPDISLHCQTTDSGLVHRTACLLIYVPAFAGNSVHLHTEGWPGWVDPGGWLHTGMAY